ncbi:MAG: hypothetical protein AAF585_09375 [Verrucomicrobiota bacterium]
MRFRIKSRKRGVALVIGLIILVSAGGFYWDWSGRYHSSTWFSSPTESRKDASSFQLVEPHEEKFERSNRPLEIRIEPQSDEFYAIHQSGEPGFWWPQVSVVEADAQHAADLPYGARLAMLTMSSSVLTPINEKEWRREGDLPLRFFDPQTFERLDDITIEAIHRQLPRESHVEGFEETHSPSGAVEKEVSWVEPVVIGFDFGFNPGDAVGDYRIEHATIYDGRNFAELGWSRPTIESLPTGQQLVKFLTPIDCFHPSPLIVQFVVAHPPQVQRLEVKTGAKFELGETSGQILFAESGNWVMTPTTISRADENGFTVIVHLQDFVHASAWSVRLFDEEDNLMPTYYKLPFLHHEARFDGTESAEITTGAHFREKPKTMELSFWPKFTHVIFRVDDLPGMPPENAGIENLYDVRIPYTEVRNVDDMLGIISSSVHQQWTPITPIGVGTDKNLASNHFAADYFPRVYRNKTVRQLLAEYYRHSYAHRISTPPEAPLEIHVELPPRETWFDRAKTRAKSWWPAK